MKRPAFVHTGALTSGHRSLRDASLKDWAGERAKANDAIRFRIHSRTGYSADVGGILVSTDAVLGANLGTEERGARPMSLGWCMDRLGPLDYPLGDRRGGAPQDLVVVC